MLATWLFSIFQLICYVNIFILPLRDLLWLQIYHLAVNALLKSSQISEFEGGTVDGDGSAAFNDGSNTWNEEIFCSPAFRVLKQLVGGWLADAISTGNNYSDALLQHVYRWICRYYCVFIRVYPCISPYRHESLDIRSLSANEKRKI